MTEPERRYRSVLMNISERRIAEIAGSLEKEGPTERSYDQLRRWSETLDFLKEDKRTPSEVWFSERRRGR
jgi:hypothetical protein